MIIKSTRNIEEMARKFIQENEHSIIFAFHGPMGVGKTTFIKAICHQLGVIDTVNSPTFSIINEYNTKNNETIYHFDFYRIESVEEIFDLGYEDYFFSGNYCFIEWPEKAENFLPENASRFTMNEIENGYREINKME